MLAAIPAVFGFIKGSLFGIDIPLIGNMRVSIGAGLSGMVLSYALSLVQVYLIALIVDALAPTFGAQKSQIQALKLAAYAFTAAWVAGIAANRSVDRRAARAGGRHLQHLSVLSGPAQRDEVPTG